MHYPILYLSYLILTSLHSLSYQFLTLVILFFILHSVFISFLSYILPSLYYPILYLSYLILTSLHSLSYQFLTLVILFLYPTYIFGQFLVLNPSFIALSYSISILPYPYFTTFSILSILNPYHSFSLSYIQFLSVSCLLSFPHCIIQSSFILTVKFFPLYIITSVFSLS